MGTFIFSSPNRPEPLTISVKRVGDTRERFLTRNGSTIAFDEDSSENVVYVSKITDGNGKISTKEFTLSCERQDDCAEGPDLLEIVEFNPTQLTYRFHGSGVNQIERQIIQNGLIIDVGIDTPSSATVTTVFSGPLARGDYELRIRGKSCYSENVNGLHFTITDDSTTLDWWPNYPAFDYNADADKYRILLAVTRAGTYPYAIKDASNAVIVSGNWTFSPGVILDFTNFDPGTYHVEVGPLTGTLVITAPPADCDEGPELLSVSSNSPTQTTFKFHGINVFVIEWFIRDTSDVIQHRGTVEPGGATVTINHPILAGGTHNLLIKGSSCTSETGIVDNLDFTVVGTSLTINSIVVEQQPDGRYKLNTNFSGGTPNYTITVRTLSNVTIGTFPNTTGSPANVMLPAGTAPQTVKVMVMDVTNSVDEENAVLPPPTMKMTFLQAPNFSAVPTRTEIINDGSIFFIGADSTFNWDIEASVPNGGLWDYIEKRLRKKVGSDFVEKSISAATGQSQNYSVSTSSNAERLFMPRNGNSIIIDGVNVFKTAGEWEFRAIVRKGGVGGAIVAQATRTVVISSPGVGSGIFLYNRNDATLGSLISEINQTGSSFPKPVPHYDFAVTDFNGATFRSIYAVLRLKVGSSYVQKFSNLLTGLSPATTITASDFSLFKVTRDVGSSTEVFAQDLQTWEIEFVGYSDTSAQVPIGTKKAIFQFTVNGSVEQGFINRGIKKTVVGSKSYQQIFGIDFGSEILPSGNVRIFYPDSRQSINGARTCYPWVYLNHVRMDPTDLAALRSGSGLSLPNGKYSFSIKYHSNAVANYDDVIDGGAAGGAYQLAGEITSLSFGYSAMDDYMTITIRDL